MKKTIRPATKEDIPFVFSTWLRGYKFNNQEMTWPIHTSTYYQHHQKVLEHVLVRPGVEVLVCCDGDDPWHIFGYLVLERPNIVHWIFVKKGLRDFTVARMLLKAAQIPESLEGFEFSHFVRAVKVLWKSRRLKGTYNPYLLYDGAGT